MRDVTEQHGPTKNVRVEGLRSAMRVQPGDPAPSRDELLPDLAAGVSAAAAREHTLSLTHTHTHTYTEQVSGLWSKTPTGNLFICHCATCVHRVKG